MATAFLRRLLAHPLTASLDLDDPATTKLRRQIIASNPILKSIYDQWYAMLARELPSGDGRALELGSGGGYCADFIPGLVTSEAFAVSGVQIVVDAQRMPFAEKSLRAIVMTNVFHHLPDVRRFLAESARCLRPGGKILMIEPWVTYWSRFVYARFHPEPFLPDSPDWAFSTSGPLSGANSALPWIVFERDRQIFGSEFPELSIERIRPFMPFRYLASGGVGLRSLLPGFAGAALAGVERLLETQMPRLGMFALIEIRRR